MLTLIKQRSFLSILWISNVLIIGTMLYTFKLGVDAVNVHSPLVDASMAIKLELTNAHLHFEEMISGDKSISLDEIKARLEESKWYANAMLHGGANVEGTFVPLKDSHLREHITRVIEQLGAVETLMQHRYKFMLTSQPGSDLDRAFDMLLDECLGHADDVRAALHQAIDNERRWLKISGFTTLVLALSLFIFILFKFRNYQVREYELRERLQKIADTDALTGIANRRNFDARLAYEWMINQRKKMPLAIAICDIDLYKRYNDTLGHQAGDRCLQLIAEIMMHVSRHDTDLVARYGGEEFAFILPATDSAEANGIIRRLHEALAKKQISHPASEISDVVTISVGIAAMIPADESNASELVAAADDALYCAKRAGRNRTVIAEFSAH